MLTAFLAAVWVLIGLVFHDMLESTASQEKAWLGSQFGGAASLFAGISLAYVGVQIMKQTRDSQESTLSNGAASAINWLLTSPVLSFRSEWESGARSLPAAPS